MGQDANQSGELPRYDENWTPESGLELDKAWARQKTATPTSEQKILCAPSSTGHAINSKDLG